MVPREIMRTCGIHLNTKHDLPEATMSHSGCGFRAVGGGRPVSHWDSCSVLVIGAAALHSSSDTEL